MNRGTIGILQCPLCPQEKDLQRESIVGACLTLIALDIVGVWLVGFIAIPCYAYARLGFPDIATGSSCSPSPLVAHTILLAGTVVTSA